MARSYYRPVRSVNHCGEIGRLNTVKTWEMAAGESLEIDFQGSVCLSPLNRPMVMDMRFDLYAFFMPDRYVYSNWTDFIREGTRENETLASYDNGSNVFRFFGEPNTTGLRPRWQWEGYLAIWDEYFRHKHLDKYRESNTGKFFGQATPSASAFRDGSSVNLQATAEFGASCMRLDAPWCVGPFERDTDFDDDAGLSIETTLESASSIDIRDLDEIKRRFSSQQDSEWLYDEYRDILEGRFGTMIGTWQDPVQRPEFLTRQNYWMSGIDVRGTDDSNLGYATGMMKRPFRFVMPPKKFDEHGHVWLLMLARFPSVVVNERDRHNVEINPDYADRASDPEIVKRPEVGKLWHFFDYSPTNGADIGLQFPHQHHRRTMASFTHERFKQGGVSSVFPWIQSAPIRAEDAVRIQPEDYKSLFKSTQYGHFQVHGQLHAGMYRNVYDPMASIKTGDN